MITRRGGAKANGLTLIGNVSGVLVARVELFDRHSHAFLIHWGGLLDPRCGRVSSPRVFDPNRAGLLSCPIVKTFHVNQVRAENVRVNGTAGHLATVSSAYDITLSNFSGVASEGIWLLPGDEAAALASDAQKSRVGSNIHFSGFDVTIPSGADTAIYPIALSSRAQSKWVDGAGRQLERTLYYSDLSVDRVRFVPDSIDSTFFKHIEFGLAAPWLRGSNINVRDVDFGQLGVDSPQSIGLYLRYGSDLGFDGIRSAASTGVLLRNTRKVRIGNSLFERAPWFPFGPRRLPPRPGSTAMTVIDEINSAGLVRPGYVSEVSVKNTQFVGHSIGVRYQPIVMPGQPNICSRVTFGPDVRFAITGMPTSGAVCATPFVLFGLAPHP